MRVMVGAHTLPEFRDFQHRIGNLFVPGSYYRSDLVFALDNGVYKAWATGKPWESDKFLRHIDKVAQRGTIPLWVVVPDAVGDHRRTLALWHEWAPRLKKNYGWPLAFAVQDGQQPNAVPADADVIFVGGTTEWKRKTIRLWCQRYPRVHVGRINTYRWLWHCHKCGAESVDGTGWFWANKREHQDLLDYLEITEDKKAQESSALFPIHEYLQLDRSEDDFVFCQNR